MSKSWTRSIAIIIAIILVATFAVVWAAQDKATPGCKGGACTVNAANTNCAGCDGKADCKNCKCGKKGSLPPEVRDTLKKDHDAIKSAMEKYKGDPDFQKMLAEQKQMRQEMRKNFKTHMQGNKENLKAEMANYKQRLQQAKTQQEKDAIKAEMKQKFAAVKEARMAEHQKNFAAFEAKYGAKYPDYFSALKKMHEDMKNIHKNYKGQGFCGHAKGKMKGKGCGSGDCSMPAPAPKK